MNILIADDHHLVRETFAAYIRSAENYTIECVDSYDAAVKKMHDNPPYDLILLDFDMPGIFGLETLKEAMTKSKGKPVGIISGIADKEIAKQFLKIGGAGFLPKSMPAESVVNAIKFMIMGEQYVPLEFITSSSNATLHPDIKKLTEREQQVLKGLCLGYSNKEIARDINLQEVTIKLHVKTLCRKLNAKNRTHAAMIAKNYGFA